MDVPFLTTEWFIPIRQRLIRFFALEGCPDPDNCADETIFRVVRALSKGATIHVNPATFTYGVAKNVENECRRRREKLKESQIYGTTPEPPLPDDPARDLLYLCLESCLDELSPLKRTLIIKYYEGLRSGDDMRNRKALAERLGISMKKLRKEAIRIRGKLERCIADCLERKR
jgi:DNA-directed RNA polymerase specialized sigma24 family protein